MNLNRRDFAKTGLGGLLAVLLPWKAKAKVKPKPEFPRYFAPVGHPDCWAMLFGMSRFIRADSAEKMVSVYDDHGEAEVAVALAVLQQSRLCREISAAEAEALLKPKPEFPRYFAPAWSEIAGSVAIVGDKHGPAWAQPRELYYANVRYLEAIRADCVVFHTLTWAGRVKYDWSTLVACEEAVAIGYLREITSAEAEALLKAKSMPWRTLTMEFPCSRKQAEMLHRLHKAEERRIKSLLNETFWK